jgi:flagellar FliL protein
MSEKKAKPAKPAAEPAEEGAEGAPAKKKLAGKTLVLFIALPALLVVGGGATAAMLLMGGGKTEVAAVDGETGEAADAEAGAKDKKGKGGDDGQGDAKGEEAGEGAIELGTLVVGEGGAPSYYDMPELLVNLAAVEGERPLFLKLELVLEASDPAAFERVPDLMPRILDQFQMFLRELRVDDLNGSAGSYRLRVELLRRLNLAIAPQRVDAVLIDGMLVQ